MRKFWCWQLAISTHYVGTVCSLYFYIVLNAHCTTHGRKIGLISFEMKARKARRAFEPSIPSIERAEPVSKCSDRSSFELSARYSRITRYGRCWFSCWCYKQFYHRSTVRETHRIGDQLKVQCFYWLLDLDFFWLLWSRQIVWTRIQHDRCPWPRDGSSGEQAERPV